MVSPMRYRVPALRGHAEPVLNEHVSAAVRACMDGFLRLTGANRLSVSARWGIEPQ